MDWLSFPCSVLTLKFQSELEGLELDLAIRVTDMATAILVTDTDIIRMDTTDRIDTTAILEAHRTTGTGTVTTATIGTITTTATKLLSWLG